ncbi:MAG: hypothetical protein ABIT05_05190 [Chitinophagaceae bacterium]
MKKWLFPLLFLFSAKCLAQADTSKWLRAFPVTAYMVDLNDSVKIVQVEMPEGESLKDKQLGLVRGVYTNSHADTVQKGYGRCNLIKGVYNYFSIGHNSSGEAIREGDLLYTFVDKTTIFFGQVPKLAAHFIEWQDVYEKPFYDRYKVFREWTAASETALVDSMVKDIQFTGNYFQENNPSMDKLITKGTFNGKKVLSVMAGCRPEYVRNFMDYVIARPRLYAGKQWKISEVFATWAVEGAPEIIKD